MRAALSEDRSEEQVLRRLVFDHGEIWWRISGVLPAALGRSDAAVALLMYAMRRGEDLHIEGTVTRRLLEHLDRYQAIWSLWRPDYRTIRVTADEEAPSRGEENTAVAAFSGGVDATATIWRHHAGLAGRSRRELQAAVMIKGFDIPLAAEQAWTVARTSAEETLASIGVPLACVETNWRQYCGDWEMEFAFGAVGCLRHWDVGTYLLGSCEDYTRLVTPWGSHPITLPLLGGDRDVEYDGGELTRTEKVAIIGQWPEGFNALRVCWQGDVTGRNCGMCEKCIRTKLNAVANGLPIPASLGERPTPAEIRSIESLNAGQRALAEEIIAVAHQKGTTDPLVEELAGTIRRIDRMKPLRAAQASAHEVKRRLRGVKRKLF